MNKLGEASRPRGWYYGWNIVAVIIFAQIAVNGLTYNCYSLFLRDWSAALHAPVSRLQLALTLLVTTSSLIAPLGGVLADKYPPRWLFAGGLLGVAAFYLAISLVTAAWQVLVLYGAIVPPALVLATAVTSNTVISRWFVRRRGLALGLSAFGIGMAGVFLPPLVALALPVLGWRVIWRIGGGVVALLVMPVVVAVVRSRPTAREGLHYTGEAAASAGMPAAARLRWRDIVARPNFWLILAAFLPILAINGGCSLNLAPYAESHGLSRQTAASLLSVLYLAQLGSTLLLGLVSDRFGNRLAFAGLAGVAASGAAVLALGSGLPVIALGSALVGCAGGLYTLLAASIAREFGAGGFGRSFGLATLFLPLTALAPFMVAKLQEITGSYTPGMLALMVPALAGGLLVLLLRERPEPVMPLE